MHQERAGEEFRLVPRSSYSDRAKEKAKIPFIDELTETIFKVSQLEFGNGGTMTTLLHSDSRLARNYGSNI